MTKTYPISIVLRLLRESQAHTETNPDHRQMEGDDTILCTVAITKMIIIMSTNGIGQMFL